MNFLSLRFAKNLINAGIIVIAISLVLLLPFRSYFSASPVDNELIGQFGDFIGGIAGSLWALAGVIMFYVALHEQRKDFETNREILSAQLDEFKLQQVELAETRKVFKEQSETLRIQRFENSFFSMINTLNELINTFTFEEGRLDSGKFIKEVYQGRNAIYKIVDLIEDDIKEQMANIQDLENALIYFDTAAIQNFHDRANNALPFIKMLEQIVFIIFESSLENERKRYVDILKSNLDPAQFSLIGLFLSSRSEQGSELLTKMRILNFYDSNSFERMFSIKFALEVFEKKIFDARIIIDKR
tara:strand:- start:13901 stop:14803 length:903 start_codon:yes stop_codon:yes gene_type:complete